MKPFDITTYFVKITAGEIELRDDRIKEKWKVKINPFFMAKFPVTQEVYAMITGENPSEFKGENLPVENVSWTDAVIFCNKLSAIYGFEICYTLNNENEVTFNPLKNGFRLPTEAEWEFACKAGNNAVRYGELQEIAWFRENAEKQTHPVGMKTPNNWGLYDVLGNVWEWCADVYDETVYGSYRIFRGGGWNDEERSVMATNRRRSHPQSFKIDDLGFRIAINNTAQ